MRQADLFRKGVICYSVRAPFWQKVQCLVAVTLMLPLPVILGKSSIGALAFNAFINWPVISSDIQAFYYVTRY
jgi:hypothetical protein